MSSSMMMIAERGNNEVNFHLCFVWFIVDPAKEMTELIPNEEDVAFRVLFRDFLPPSLASPSPLPFFSPEGSKWI